MCQISKYLLQISVFDRKGVKLAVIKSLLIQKYVQIIVMNTSLKNGNGSFKHHDKGIIHLKIYKVL